MGVRIYGRASRYKISRTSILEKKVAPKLEVTTFAQESLVHFSQKSSQVCNIFAHKMFQELTQNATQKGGQAPRAATQAYNPPSYEQMGVYLFW